MNRKYEFTGERCDWMNRKYEFTGETKNWIGRKLHRIRAVRDFGDVKAGDLGGWIEKERNLSHDGDAWVYGNAEVYGDAWVYGNAWVYGDARVSGNAKVSGNAEVYGRKHILWISMIGSRDDTVTFMRAKDEKIIVAVGCFGGTIDEFEKAVEETHGDNEHGKAYSLVIELAKLRIDLHKEEEDDTETGEEEKEEGCF